MRFVTALLITTFAATLQAQKPTPRARTAIRTCPEFGAAGNRSIRPADERASIKVLLPLEGVDQDNDNVFAALDRISVAERAKDANTPPYKPELLAKVKNLEVRQSQEAPAFYCKPAGVPRMGPPAQIVQLPDTVIFLYGTNLFRLIPLGAAHRKDIDTSYMGDSVATWESDTLVVDVNHLNDALRRTRSTS